MITAGEFYMHRKDADTCVLVLAVKGNGMADVLWHSIGLTGEVWPSMQETQELYMHPDVWANITELVKPLEAAWSN